MTEETPTLKGQLREFYMRRRRSMIADLGAVEDLLGLPRSIPPRREREKQKLDVTERKPE